MSEAGDSLVEFIRAAKQKSADDTFVVDLLRSRGWSEKKILDAFAAYYETETGLGVPSRGRGIEAARDAFLHLLSFLALGTWTTSLGSLFYTLIDRRFPAISGPQYFDRYSISYEMAGIIVAFPLYLLIMRSMTRAAAANPERLQSPTRKWLTYIALLIAAAIVLGDVVTFLAYFLRGDLTVRFTLKVLTLLVLAGGVLSYYLTTLRDEAPPRKHNLIYAGVAMALVLAGVILGYSPLGSRSQNQAWTRDGRRLTDLSTIGQQVYSDWARTYSKEPYPLPRNADELAQRAPAFTQRTDPETGKRYGYIPQSGTRYLLCADFEASTPPDWQGDQLWRHGAGHACIAFDATRTEYYNPGYYGY